MPMPPLRLEATPACHAVGLSSHFAWARIERTAIALEARAGRPSVAGAAACESKPPAA